MNLFTNFGILDLNHFIYLLLRDIMEIWGSFHTPGLIFLTQSSPIEHVSILNVVVRKLWPRNAVRHQVSVPCYCTKDNTRLQLLLIVH